MEEIKDLVWIIITVGGLMVTLVGIYWRIRYQFKENLNRFKEGEKKFCEQEKRIIKLETAFRGLSRKLTIIEQNLVKIMEKLEVEPVKNLFEDEEL